MKESGNNNMSNSNIEDNNGKDQINSSEFPSEYDDNLVQEYNSNDFYYKGNSTI